MFTNNKFGKLDAVADAIKSIAEADYKAKMEELKGQQHKIDKNKNNKIDSDDFKILRGEKKTVKEDAVEEANNPFDVKNYKSQLKSKPGEKAGFDSKKISTGTVYSRKPVKDEPMKKEEIDPNDTTTDTLKGREKTSDNKFLSKKVAMDVPDNVKEEAEQIDELKKATIKSYLAKKMASLPGKDPKKDQKDMMKAHHRVTGVKPTSEEVELDEANIQPTGAKSRTHIGNLKSTSNSVVHPSSGKEIGIITKQPNGEYHAHHSAAKLSHSESGTFDSKDKAHQFIRNAHAKAIKNNTLSDTFLKKKPLPQFAKEEVELDERTLTKGETKEKERIVKGMKKSLAGFKQRYGDKAKSVATKAAKKD